MTIPRAYNYSSEWRSSIRSRYTHCGLVHDSDEILLLDTRCDPTWERYLVLPELPVRVERVREADREVTRVYVTGRCWNSFGHFVQLIWSNLKATEDWSKVDITCKSARTYQFELRSERAFVCNGWMERYNNRQRRWVVWWELRLHKLYSVHKRSWASRKDSHASPSIGAFIIFEK